MNSVVCVNMPSCPSDCYGLFSLMDQPDLSNWSNQSFLPIEVGGEMEEGEVRDDISDYSPGTLVIDHVEQGREGRREGEGRKGGGR